MGCWVGVRWVYITPLLVIIIYMKETLIEIKNIINNIHLEEIKLSQTSEKTDEQVHFLSGCSYMKDMIDLEIDKMIVEIDE